jgi:hypothetical protein
VRRSHTATHGAGSVSRGRCASPSMGAAAQPWAPRT